MSISLDQFRQELSKLDVNSDESLAAALNAFDKTGEPQEPQTLADWLVRQKLLTPYQRQQLLSGQGKSLLMGNYLILDQLGKGGMGVVLKARHQRMDRLVALKVISAREVSSPDAVKRFHREVQAAARLTHPNIVIAYDADEADGVHFLVMEFVAGTDLHQYVQQRGPLSVENAATVLVQAARGLDFSHQQGVVHRDIKPANLLMDARGVVKILDMGLARIDDSLGGSAQGSGLTQTGMIMGTVDFMSPEQAIDTKQADGRSDIYSLGCTFYYLVSRETLYSGDTLMKRLMAHQSAPIPPLLERLPDESLDELTQSRVETINQIFLMMVAKRKEDRYQLMSEVVTALEDFLQVPAGAPMLWKHRQPSESADPSFVLMPPSALRPPRSGTGGQLKTGGVSQPTVMMPVQPVADETIITSAATAPETMIQRGASSSVVRKRVQRTRMLGGALVLMVLAGLGIWGLARPQTTADQPQQMAAATLPVTNTPESGPADATIGQWTPDSAQLAFFQYVSHLSPAQQAEAVRKKMVEINPQLKETDFSIESNDMAVESFRCVSDAEQIDIWPVHALKSLKAFSARGESYSGLGEWRRRGVKDLSPLAGLALQRLVIQGMPIQSLAPLREMPLKQVDVDVTSVSDLSPLKGIALNSLSCNGTAVSDLEPLRGMPLSALGCAFTKVTDLSPLAGMKLEILNIAGAKVTSLGPLRGMPLIHLDCRLLSIRELTPIENAPLKTLICSRIPEGQQRIIQQLPLEKFECDAQHLPEYGSFLKRMPTLKLINQKPAQQVLDSLPPELKKTAVWTPNKEQQTFFEHIAGLTTEDQVVSVRKKMLEVNAELRDAEMTHQIETGRVTNFECRSDAITIDLWPVRALSQLQSLTVRGQTFTGEGEWKPRGVRSLGPLSGLPLQKLVVQGVPIEDLTPLIGMPLERLELDVTLVSDLTPLKEIPLKHLACNGTRISDLEPLRGMPLTALSLAFTKVTDLTPLHGMPLNTLNVVGTKVKDLTSLAGMPLNHVDCRMTEVSELSPLRQAPLHRLYFSSLPTSQFELLQALPVTTIVCDEPFAAENHSLFRKIKTLISVNGVPVQQFLETKAGMTSATAEWTPDFDQQAFLDEAATLAPPDQVEAVRKKLSEINPGWDSQQFTCLIGPQGVQEVQIPPLIDDLKIWPVRAFSQLNRFKSLPAPLVPGESWTHRGISDLSPLRGLPITFVHIERAPLKSVEPLSEMKLNYLGISYTQVSDLSPIQKMPLTALGISGIPITDLKIPGGMRGITGLYCGNLPVTDLSQISSLSLTHLGCAGSKVTDLSPLKGMPLILLDINQTNVADLSPLQGMPMDTIYCMETKVTNLVPLAGMPLKKLNLYKSPVTDLSPLQGAPLEFLNINSTGVTRLDALNNSQLKELHCSPSIITANYKILSGLMTLQTINDTPARMLLDKLKPGTTERTVSMTQ